MLTDPFFESTVRIEAADFGDSSHPNKHIPARVGASQCGVFAVMRIDRGRVEVSWLHHPGSIRLWQVLRLIQVATSPGHHRSLLRCPVCPKWRTRLFFVGQHTGGTPDFSFACLECAESSPGSVSAGIAKAFRRRTRRKYRRRRRATRAGSTRTR